MAPDILLPHPHGTIQATGPLDIALRNAKNIVFLSPHPDDVELACGILIRRLVLDGADIRYVCVTDGAPRSAVLVKIDRLRDGYDQLAYKSTRHSETSRALDFLGVPAHSRVFLDFPDLETHMNIDRLVRHLGAILSDAGAVFSCPFEGGHPDHDICRFALGVAAADAAYRGPILEYASYNEYGYQVFASAEPAPTTLVANEEERLAQQFVAELFMSQQPEPTYFSCDLERFRIAARHLEANQYASYPRIPHYEQFAYPGSVVLESISAFLNHTHRRLP